MCARENGRPKLNIFGNPEFKLFRDSLDAEMKRFISVDVGVEIKQVQQFMTDKEEIFWNKGLPGVHNGNSWH